MPDTRNFAVCLPDPPVPASAPKAGLPVDIGDITVTIDDGGMTVMTTQVVQPPVQPCITVDGVVDPDAFMVLIDGVPTAMNLAGEITGVVAFLDPCDPLCAPEACVQPSCCDVGSCADCDPATLAAVYP